MFSEVSYFFYIVEVIGMFMDFLLIVSVDVEKLSIDDVINFVLKVVLFSYDYLVENLVDKYVFDDVELLK